MSRHPGILLALAPVALGLACTAPAAPAPAADAALRPVPRAVLAAGQEPRPGQSQELPPLPRLQEGGSAPLPALPRAATGAPVDFAVDFAATGRPVPPGLLAGLNEYNNSWPGVWQAYHDYLQPRRGLVRLWVMYDITPFGRQHVAAGLRARKAGMDVMLCGAGLPENYPRKADELPERASKEPRDPEAWARRLARDARAMLDAGVPLTHVEIWNEPAMPGRWYVDPEPFASFYAAAGKVLREELPRGIRIGGPGETHVGSRTLERFRLEFEACKRTGFRPDFLSWHDYVGYPTDQESLEMSTRLRRLAARYGLEDAELILSEWNYTLPPDPILDSYANGAYYVALTTALTRTGVEHSLFLMLQDGPWEAKEDFKGQGAGIFTVNGAPKPVFQGMQMMRIAGELPAVPVTRREAPWNLTLFASRQGDHGWLLAADAFGKAQDSIRKYLDYAGVDMSLFKNRRQQIRGFLEGRLSFERLGAPARDRPAWEQARSRLAAHKRESKAALRPVLVRLEDPPARILGVWALDARHGDPLADPDFRRRFEELRSGVRRQAAQATLERLRGQGVAESDLRALEAAFAGRQAEARSVDPRLRRRAQGIFAEEQERLSREIPLELAAHPAARPHPVPVADYLRWQDGTLVLQMTPFSALLVELSWERGDG